MQMIKHLPQLGKVTQCSQTLCSTQSRAETKDWETSQISCLRTLSQIRDGREEKRKKMMPTTVPASPVQRALQPGNFDV